MTRPRLCSRRHLLHAGGFGLGSLALASLWLSGWGEPQAKRELDFMLQRLGKTAVAARLMPGEIASLPGGLSVYIEERDQARLSRVFLAQDTDEGGRVLWAKEADLNDSQGGLRLLLRDGGFLMESGGLEGRFADLSLFLPASAADGGRPLFPEAQMRSLPGLFGESGVLFRLERVRRMTLPLAFLLFAVFAAAFAGTRLFASGLAAYAATGIDLISTSAPVTRSAWLDLSMRFTPAGG